MRTQGVETKIVQKLPREVRAAYLATHYIVEADDGDLTLRIGEACPVLGQLLRRHGASGACFVTAWNPFGKPPSETDNAIANRRLEHDLRSHGWTVFAGRGEGEGSDWPPEPSFLALGPTRAEAIDLCQRYLQNAVVYAGVDTVPELLMHPDLVLSPE